MSVVIFVGILVVLIVVHEMGHFIVAKIFHIRVDEFGVGYPPRAFTVWKKGDTTYTINWIPFGGFVRIFGEDADTEYSEEDAAVAFVRKPRKIQALVLIAGIVFNLLFAWFLFSTALLIGAPTEVSESQADVTQSRLVISAVLPQSPAAAVGLTAGDRIVSIHSGTDVLKKVIPSAVTTFIQGHTKDTLVITYVRKASTKEIDTVPFAPAHGVLVDSPGTPAVGIAMVLVADTSLSIVPAIVQGFTKTVQSSKMIAVGLGTFFYSIATGTANWAQVAGPVGIATMVGDASSVGIVYLMYFTAFISINLAVINLLPLPALDGGRLLFIVIEAIMRRPIRNRTATIINIIGFSAIILLMLVVTYHDILKLFQ